MLKIYKQRYLIPAIKNRFKLKNTAFLFCLGLFFCLAFASCDLVNPEEQLPAYLDINKFDFSITAEQGIDSEQITDAWVFVNDISLGIYQLPATVPVLELGNQKISIFPVIRENALPSAPIIYPFYQRFEQNLELVADQTFTIQPTTSYIKNAVFEMVEEFEDANHRLNGGDPNALQIVEASNVSLHGKGVGQILLNGADEVTFTSSATFTDLPTTGNLAVFLELDYKANVEFEIGLVGLNSNPTQPVNATSYKITLCPIDQWNKLYLNFQEDLEFSQLPAYKLAFRVSNKNTGCTPFNDVTPEVLIDNLKFIRFQN
jgi:hypothetical protein